MKIIKKYKPFFESEIENFCEDFCLATGHASVNYKIKNIPEDYDALRQCLEITPAEGTSGAFIAPEIPDVSKIWDFRRRKFRPSAEGISLWIRKYGDLKRSTLEKRVYQHTSFLGYDEFGAEYITSGDGYIAHRAYEYTDPSGVHHIREGYPYEAFFLMKEGHRSLLFVDGDVSAAVSEIHLLNFKN